MSKNNNRQGERGEVSMDRTLNSGLGLLICRWLTVYGEPYRSDYRVPEKLFLIYKLIQEIG